MMRKLQSLISRAVVDSGNALYKVLWQDERVSANVEYSEPQGVHFRLPADALGLLLSPGADKSASVLVAAQGRVPTDATEPGEGGLHYLGAFKLFLAADGTIAIGAFSPSMWGAIGDLVDARLAAIVGAHNTHTHPAPGGATSAPTTPMASQASVKSTKVRMEP